MDPEHWKKEMHLPDLDLPGRMHSCKHLPLSPLHQSPSSCHRFLMNKKRKIKQTVGGEKRAFQKLRHVQKQKKYKITRTGILVAKHFSPRLKISRKN